MRYSFNCFNHSTWYGIGPTLPQQITAAAEAGYDLIGLDVPSLLAHEAAGTGPERIGELLSAAGVGCFELVPLSLADDGTPVIDAARSAARLASAVGAAQVLATVRDPDQGRVVDHLRTASAVLGEVGATVSVEFMPRSALPTLETALELVERVDDDRVRIVIDSWQFILSASSWEVLEGLPGDRVGFVQLADAPAGASGDSLEDSMQERLMPGEGELPLVRFRDTLLRGAFEEPVLDGVVSVEVLSRAWRSRPLAEFAGATLRAARNVWEGPGS